jgi:hypothetical protein
MSTRNSTRNSAKNSAKGSIKGSAKKEFTKSKPFPSSDFHSDSDDDFNNKGDALPLEVLGQGKNACKWGNRANPITTAEQRGSYTYSSHKIGSDICDNSVQLPPRDNFTGITGSTNHGLMNLEESWKKKVELLEERNTKLSEHSQNVDLELRRYKVENLTLEGQNSEMKKNLERLEGELKYSSNQVWELKTELKRRDGESETSVSMQKVLELAGVDNKNFKAKEKDWTDKNSTLINGTNKIFSPIKSQ